MTAVISRAVPDTDLDTPALPSAGAPGPVVAPEADIDLDRLAEELDAIRDGVLDSLGQDDADYLRGILRLQRSLELGGRAALWVGVFPPAWLAGTAMLSLSKILENMEVGHNVMHGQWDWMRDDQIHSTTWEWDNVCPSTQWRHTHNHMHHQWTNVAGMDHDIGYGVIRIDGSQRWHPANIGQPLYFLVLAALFEYGVGMHDVSSSRAEGKGIDELRPKLLETLAKIRRQVAKDYVAFPLLSAPFGIAGIAAAASGALVANLVRNVWSFSVIFCGHFPDDVQLFTEEEVQGESRGGWYRRQILGSANFEGGPIMNLLSGNLDHQIEHHLFPDLPSSRYAEIAPQVQDVCERHGLHYNTGSMVQQFGSVVRKVLRFSLPFT